MHVIKQDNKDNNLLIHISHLNDELIMKNKNEDAQFKIIVFQNSKILHLRNIFKQYVSKV